jgi:DNA polymerase-1
MSSHPAKRLFLIDGMSHIFRAFYAIRDLSNNQGLPTNAIYGFAAMLRKLIRQYHPEYMAVAFDGREKTFRHEVFEQYKANRTEMPDDLAQQLPYIRKLCECLRIPILEAPRYEADDVIGTLAKRAEHENFDVIIVSNDKDMFQLVSEKTKVLHQAKEDVVFDPNKVQDYFGVSPEGVIDVLGLMGDSVDNVPGAPGIGEKGARDLISRFGSLDNLLAHSSEVERKTYREALQNHRDQILRSRELVTIDTGVPVEIDWHALEMQPPQMAQLKDLFTELGFQSMLKDFEKESGQSIPPPASSFFHKISSAERLPEVLKELKKCSRADCYLECEGGEPMLARALALAVQGIEKDSRVASGWVVHFGQESQIKLEDWREFWEDPGITKVFHNAKAVSVLLRKQGMRLQGVAWDTMLLSYLIHPNRSNHNFEEIAFAVFEKTPPPAPDQRCVITGQLLAVLKPKLEELKLEKVYQEIESPLVDVLAEMECNGVRIDTAALQQMSQEMEKQIEILAGEIYRVAGTEFNMNSPRQLGEILFEKLNLPAPKKLKKSGQYSTSVEILEQLAADYELPRLMLEYRQLTKLKSTYIDALPKLVNPQTGRVHTSFNQTIAATGRLSSSNPNLQNIPIRTDEGMRIRSAFIPSNGCVLLAADYSQIELRILAHLSEDPVLMESFKKGEDVHTRTAYEVFGFHPDIQTREIRRRAKSINFGIIYGQTAFGLAKELGISNREAQQFIQRYFERYKGVKEFIDRSIAETRETLVTRTLFGRLRQIPEINSKNPALRNFAERTAVNSPIQGTAADIIKLAMISIHCELQRQQLRTKMILQVHDELVFDAPEGEVERVQGIVKSKMESVYELSVPLIVEIGTGKNWMET